MFNSGSHSTIYCIAPNACEGQDMNLHCQHIYLSHTHLPPFPGKFLIASIADDSPAMCLHCYWKTVMVPAEVIQLKGSEQ